MANEDQAKRIKELEAKLAEQESTIASQKEVENDLIQQLENSEVSRKIQKETFTHKGKLYAIEFPSIVIPRTDTSEATPVTAKQIAADVKLQEALLAIEGFKGFTEIKK